MHTQGGQVSRTHPYAKGGGPCSGLKKTLHEAPWTFWAIKCLSPISLHAPGTHETLRFQYLDFQWAQCVT